MQICTNGIPALDAPKLWGRFQSTDLWSDGGISTWAKRNDLPVPSAGHLCFWRHLPMPRESGSKRVMPRWSVFDRRVERNWPRLGHRWRRFCPNRLERAVVVEELIEHALDRRFDVVGTAIAHVGVLVAGLYHRNARLLTDLAVGHDTRIGFERGILGSLRHRWQFVRRHKIVEFLVNVGAKAPRVVRHPRH